ncbi:MAG: type II toxin-antitoxin system prevent-host-death family antitoxin [Pyrinomonadaceae bacterium]
MKTANIAELKNRLSAYLEEVKRGGEVLVSERNVPFAKIVPLRNTDDYDAEEMELVAKGIMSLPEIDEPLPDSFWEAERPDVPIEKILEIIREERDAR